MDYKKAFSQTDFIIDDTALNSDKLVINIGHVHPTLDNLIANEDWCFITAWNPSPHVYTKEKNDELNSLLESKIQELHRPYFKAYGQSNNSDWRENSFLIAGISREDSIQLGKEFNQMAIVIGSKSKEATLIMLR